MKTIGLIGGMSWESTVRYYALINRETARLRGGLHSAPMLIHSLDFAPIAAMQAAGEWQKAEEILVESATSLAAAGAGIVILATNTMHIAAGAIEAAVPGRFIHIADPVADALLADGAQTVGLLGTRFTMEMDFLKDRLRARELTPLVPEIGHTDLDAIIFEQLCRGIVTEPSRATYVSAIERLGANGAQAIILGCTELNMLIDETNSPLPVYDTTELHARAAVTAALA